MNIYIPYSCLKWIYIYLEGGTFNLLNTCGAFFATWIHLSGRAGNSLLYTWKVWKSLIFLTSVFLLIHFFGCYKQKSPKFKRTWNKYLAFIAENFACLQKYTLANFLQEKKDWESCQLSPFSHFCDWFCTERSRTLSSKGLANHPEKLVVVFKVYFSKMTQILNLFFFHVVFTGNIYEFLYVKSIFI